MTKKKDPKDLNRNKKVFKLVELPKAVGSPSKYKPEFCLKIIEYFSRPLTKTTEIKHYTKGEISRIEEKEIANDIPMFGTFAWDECNVTHSTMLDWVKKYPEFNESYARAKDLQKDFININTMKGLFNAQYAQFLAKNITDMKDTFEVNEDRQINVNLYLPDNGRQTAIQAKKPIQIDIKGESITDENKP